jgi:hypothetical protein
MGCSALSMNDNNFDIKNRDEFSPVSPVLLDGGSSSATGTMKDPKLHTSPLNYIYLNVPDCYVHIIESDQKRSQPLNISRPLKFGPPIDSAPGIYFYK